MARFTEVHSVSPPSPQSHCMTGTSEHVLSLLIMDDSPRLEILRLEEVRDRNRLGFWGPRLDWLCCSLLTLSALWATLLLHLLLVLVSLHSFLLELLNVLLHRQATPFGFCPHLSL